MNDGIDSIRVLISEIEAINSDTKHVFNLGKKLTTKQNDDRQTNKYGIDKMIINRYEKHINNYQISIFTIKLDPISIVDLDNKFNIIEKSVPERYETSLILSFNGDESWNIERLFISIDENKDKANDYFQKLKTKYNRFDTMEQVFIEVNNYLKKVLNDLKK